MKREFLASGSPDCPPIRLFPFNRQEIARLQKLFESLSDGSATNLALHEQAGFEQVNPCRPNLRVRKADEGLRAVAPETSACVLSEAAWDNMAGLVESLCKPNAAGCQWINQSAGILLLLSCDGRW